MKFMTKQHDYVHAAQEEFHDRSDNLMNRVTGTFRLRRKDAEKSVTNNLYKTINSNLNYIMLMLCK
jgi:hypothetical protein